MAARHSALALKESHSHNLSINSISSIIEPTTPPSAGSGTTNSKLWDNARLNGHLALPSFNLDKELSNQGHVQAHGRHLSNSDLPSLVLSSSVHLVSPPAKIDKDYLALLNKVPLLHLHGQILRLAKDQYGCRFLQKRLDENVVASELARMANFELIFKEVHLLMYELIIDPFGNYLMQKLVDYCLEADLDLVLEVLDNNLFLISINQHGTRALQKVIDHMSNAHQLSLLMKGLKPYIIELIKDLNGNHVIQKILNKYPPDNCQFIYTSIIDDILVVATHKHGCCVLQKCLNHVNPSQLSAFSEKILQYNVFTVLVNDQFGNYVLQYLISIDSVDVNYGLFNNFVKYGINELCNLKFSSNVVEKLMKNCYHNEAKLLKFTELKFSIISSILHTDLNKLINDPYGNYVIQTLIDILINPNVSYIVDLASGEKRLLPSLQQLLPQNSNFSFDSLQVQIIKHWFQNCKIVSSFGKRIQLKINIVLNGVSKSSGRKYLLLNQGNMMFSGATVPNQNMNANGEFVQTRVPMATTYPMQNSAIHHDWGYPSRGYNNGGYQRSSRPSTQQYYEGYAASLNNGLGPSPVPRDTTASFESLVNPSLSATALLANLHISGPNKAPIDQSPVSYNNAHQSIPKFISNDFTNNTGGPSMGNSGVMATAHPVFDGHYAPRPDYSKRSNDAGMKRYLNPMKVYSGFNNQGFVQGHQSNASPGNFNFFRG